MGKGRLETFSDAVFAIIITIMVLELRRPTRPTSPPFAPGARLPQLCPQLRLPGDLLEQSSPHAALHQPGDGGDSWANLYLLFWLSLVPFVTAWMGEDHLASPPTALYGVVLLMAAIAYLILQRQILRSEGPESLLAVALGSDLKGKISLSFYLLAIAAAFLHPGISVLLYLLGAVMWLIPDRRIERALAAAESQRQH